MEGESVAYPLEYLSHSRLEAYRTCSLKFRYAYIDKLKPAFTPAPLAYGIAFHRAVEEALVGLLAGTIPAVDDLVTIVAGSLDEQGQDIPIRFGEKESREGMVEQARAMLTAWSAWISKEEGRIIAVEHEFRIPLAEWLPPLVGRVDVVLDNEEEEGTIDVLDVKTSRSRWDADDLAQHAGQLALYRAGVADLVRELDRPVRVGFEIVTKTKAPVVERLYLAETCETIDRQVKAATIILEGIEHGIYVPSPGWQCVGCGFKEACRSW